MVGGWYKTDSGTVHVCNIEVRRIDEKGNKETNSGINCGKNPSTSHNDDFISQTKS